MRAQSSSSTRAEKPQRFIDTIVSPASGKNCSPSSVYSASAPFLKIFVRSVTPVSIPSSISHTPRATEPNSVTVFFRR